MAESQPSASPRPYRLGKRAGAAAATRERILEAGWIEVERAGYRPATVEAVAERAGVTRMTVYRHFPSRGALLEAIAWHRIGQAQLDTLDDARNDVDVVEGTRRFLLENCLLLAETGPILRAMIDVEREEPELAAVLDLTYRGRRVQSVRQLARRIVDSPHAVGGWRIAAVTDALTILTTIETYETITIQSGSTPRQAAQLLFHMTGSFLVPNARSRTSRMRSR